MCKQSTTTTTTLNDASSSSSISTVVDRPTNNNDNNNCLGRPLKILVVTCDLPSHPYACAKLATVLAKNGGHDVTLVAPSGPAYECIKKEVAAHTTQNDIKIQTGAVGFVTTKKQVNARPVVDPLSMSTLTTALIHGSGLGPVWDALANSQEGMYAPLLELIDNNKDEQEWDLVIPVHSIAATVCDAVEASERQPACIIFSSLPYDSGLFQNRLQVVNEPHSLVTFPHTSLYDSPNNNKDNHQFSFSTVKRRFWKWLDAWCMEHSYHSVKAKNDERRIRRGLDVVHQHPAMEEGVIGYFRGPYHCITFGGVAPFDHYTNRHPSTTMPNHVTGIGTLHVVSEVQHQAPNSCGGGDNDEQTLQAWMDREDGDIVYVCFGTGTTLDEEEVSNLVTELLADLPSTTRILFAMRSSEQKSHLETLNRLELLSSSSSSETNDNQPPSSSNGVVGDDDAVLEYAGGRLRIQDNCPQAALLCDPRVTIFVSHFGMGGFCEGIAAGIPMVAYPSGLDQYQNAHRAIHDIGMAVPAPWKLCGIGAVVKDAMGNHALKVNAEKASHQLAALDSANRTCQVVERIVRQYQYERAHPVLCGGLHFPNQHPRRQNKCNDSRLNIY